MLSGLGARPLSGPAVLALQRAVGNAAVARMIEESRHQHGAGCGHPQPATAATAPVQRSAVHDVLRTGGSPLDNATRADMESRLGADFSDVRIHNDSAARASAAEVGARAYTSGNHVVVGGGGTDKHTLAHELTHVIQQRQGPVAGTDNGSGLQVSDPSDRFERAAEANATRAMSGPAPSPAGPQGAAATAGGSSAPTAVQGAPAIQRLVGFEAEVSAPSYKAVTHDPATLPARTGVSATDMDHISSMFFGGLDYGTELIDKKTSEGWYLTSDHNPLQRFGKSLYLAIARAGADRGQILIPKVMDYVSISNLEYVSTPIDELAPGSDKVFASQLGSMSRHMEQLFNGQVRSALAPITGSAYATGFPDQALHAWLGDEIWNAVATERKAFADAIGLKLSIQATAGVLPSGMPELYAAHGTRMAGEPSTPATEKAVQSRAEAAAAVPSNIDALFSAPDFQAQISGLTPLQQQQIRGLLNVALSYVIGNAMNQTALFGPTSTSKNAVPFLVKFDNLSQVSTATGPNPAVPSPALIQTIATWFHSLPLTSPDYWTAKYSVARGTGDSRQPIHGDAANPVQGTVELLHALFSGNPGFQTIGPGKPLGRPDAPSPHLRGSEGGQGGVPMEFRWGGKAGNLAEFGQKATKFVTEVRDANMAHLAEADRQHLRGTFA